MKIVIVACLLAVCMLCFTVGFFMGIDDQRKTQHKLDCSKFKYKPASEVTADCMKYFK